MAPATLARCRRVIHTEPMVMGQSGALVRALIGIGAAFLSLACSGRSTQSNEALEEGQSGGAGTSVAGASAGAGAPDSPSAGAGGVAGIGAAGSGGGQSASGGEQAMAGDTGVGPLPLGVCPEESHFAPGLVACAGSFVHRSEPTGCALPTRTDVGTGLDGDSCASDADCAEGTYCLDDPRLFGAELRCTNACAADSDCGSSQICLCEPSMRAGTAAIDQVGRCAWTGCASDADCDVGSFCRAPIIQGCDGSEHLGGFKCQSPYDECSGPAECPSPEIGYLSVCAPPPDGTYAICHGVEDGC
jgi:hypothetical protein